MKTGRTIDTRVRREDIMKLKVERRSDGQLWASQADEERAVWVRRCFPWSEPTRFVSLRDHEKNEFALISDIAELDDPSRDALEGALVEAGFVLDVERVLMVKEEIEIRLWRVQTAQGERSFQTRLDEWPREVPGGGFIIRDVAGDLYHVADPEALDAASRELLWAFVE